MANESANSDKLREIKRGTLLLTPVNIEANSADPVEWLRTQAKPGMLLLAHADDGVIWGKVVNDENGKADFKVAKEQAILRRQTLMMARIFDTTRELFLWRVDETKWCARLIEDGKGEASEYFDENQILWGADIESQADGFVYLVEGAQGLRHSPPSELMTGNLQKHATKLIVRHYLASEDGWSRVMASRLVKQATGEVQA